MSDDLIVSRHRNDFYNLYRILRNSSLRQAMPLSSSTPSLFGAVLLTVLSVFGISLYRGYGEADARALTFSTLIVGLLSLIFVNRSWSRSILGALSSPNRAFWWVVAGALGFLAAVLYIPALESAFRFAPLRATDLAICFVAGMVSFFLIELLKLKRPQI